MLSKITSSHTKKLIFSMRDSSKNIALKFSTVRSTELPKKSWVPTEQTDLQKVTTQALIHDISMQQMEATARVVPWYLKNLPVSVFITADESTFPKCSFF